MKTLVLVLCLVFLAGCNLARPGKARASAGELQASFQTPNNPKTSSSQVLRRTTTYKFAAPKVGEQTFNVPAEIKTPSEISVVESSSVDGAAMVEKVVNESVETQVSGSMFDEIKSKMASFRGIQYLGALVLLFAAAMFHPVVRKIVGGGKSTQVATALVGLALIFGPSLVVGNEKLLLIACVGFLAWHWFTSRSSYLEGKVDANGNGIPDAQEKTSAVSSETATKAGQS